MRTTARKPAAWAAALATAGTLALPAAASADETIVAAFQNRYQNPEVTIDQGERLDFRNDDVANHDVTSEGSLNGKPLFATPIIGNGEQAFVEGSQYLTAGRYPFICSVHPFMKGALTVTALGSPVPRPDTDAPAVKGKVTSGDIGKVARSGKLNVKVTVSEQASVALKASVGRTKLGSAAGEGTGTLRLTVRLGSAARRKLAGMDRATVKVKVTARDAAGNAKSRTLTGKLR